MSETLITDGQRETLESFATTHGIELIDSGTAGFGRPSVGFSRDGNYIDTRPLDGRTFEEMPGYDDQIIDAAPDNAYHKHNCLSVLARGDDFNAALIELHSWVVAMNKIGVEVVSYDKKPGNAMQAMLTGTTGWAVRALELKQEEE